MVHPDHWITRMARDEGMIEPFAEDMVREAVVSYGVGSYGYDMRCSRRFKRLRPDAWGALDPKKADPQLFEDVETDCLTLPPHGLALAESLERFRIPRDALAVVWGKSTYARCGLLVNVTPLEPEWEGHVTMSISNLTPLPVKVHAEEGLAQVVFLRASAPCEVSYADRKGKYQGDEGATLAKT